MRVTQTAKTVSLHRLTVDWSKGTGSPESEIVRCDHDLVYDASNVLTRSDVIKSDGVSPTAYEANYSEPIVATVFLEVRQYQRYPSGGQYGVFCTHEGQMTFGNPFSGISVPNTEAYLRNAALTMVRKRLKDQQINIALALAQRRETLGLIKNTAMVILDLLVAIKRRDFRKFSLKGKTPSHIAKDLADSYLAYTFGIVPLIKDIQGMLVEFARPPSSGVVVVYGKASDSTTDSAPGTINSGDCMGRPYSHCLFSFKWTRTINQSVKASARMKVSLPRMQDLSRTGLLNPLAVMWDIVPYSFCLDFVYGVATWLNTLDAEVGYEFLSCYSTYRQETSIFSTGGLTPSQLYADRFGGYATGRGTLNGSGFSRSMKRTVHNSLPGVSPVVRNPLSPFVASVVAALLAQHNKTLRLTK